MCSWGHKRSCYMFSTSENHVSIDVLRQKVRFSESWALFFLHQLTTQRGMIILLPCPSFCLLFYITNHGQDLSPILSAHIFWSAVVGTESQKYLEVLQILLLYFSLLGQDHTAFNSWRFLTRPVCDHSKLDLFLTGKGLSQVGLKKEDFPSKGNRETCKSRERKNEQEL